MIGQALRKLAHHLGYQLSIDLPCFLDGDCQRVALSPVMALAFADHILANVSVLQIGAYDGLCNDHLFSFLERANWSGVLAEANPSIYSQLITNNSHRKGRIKCINVAIGDGRSMPFYSVNMSLAEGMPAWVDQIGGFTPSHIQKHSSEVAGLSECITQTMMETVTPSDLITQYFDEPPHVVVTDCEGYDFTILKMFDFEKYRPLVYIFESKHMSRKQLDSAFRLLAKHNYSVSWGGQDSVAIHKSLLSQ